jgi:hypothetical protein
LGFGDGFTVAVFFGAGGVVVVRFVVGVAERVVVRLVVEVLGAEDEGVVDGLSLAVETARPAPPPPQAARSRATRVIQMVCRTGIEGSPAAVSGPGGPNGGTRAVPPRRLRRAPYGVRRRCRREDQGDDVHYREAPWLIEYASHPDVVRALTDAGLLPAGCLVFDDGSDGALAWADAYDDDTNAYFLQQHERPAPVLATADSTTVVEVSDMHGAPSVRCRSVLSDGTLVETLLRWPEVPPWPRRMEKARFLSDVEVEMTRQAARGRVVTVADGGPETVLDQHLKVLAVAERLREAEPLELTTMDEVVSLWNAALVHGQ